MENETLVQIEILLPLIIITNLIHFPYYTHQVNIQK